MMNLTKNIPSLNAKCFDRTFHPSFFLNWVLEMTEGGCYFEHHVYHIVQTLCGLLDENAYYSLRFYLSSFRPFLNSEEYGFVLDCIPSVFLKRK